MALYVFVSCSARNDVGELDGTSGPAFNNNANMKNMSNACFWTKSQKGSSSENYIVAPKVDRLCGLSFFPSPDYFQFMMIFRKLLVKISTIQCIGRIVLAKGP